MIRATIDQDEWWPVYSLDITGVPPVGALSDGYTVIELSDEEHADYVRVQAEFDAWQHRLATVDDVRRAVEDAEARLAAEARRKEAIKVQQATQAARRAEAKAVKLRLSDSDLRGR